MPRARARGRANLYCDDDAFARAAAGLCIAETDRVVRTRTEDFPQVQRRSGDPRRAKVELQIRRDKLCQEIGENMKKSDASQGQSPSQLISKRIAELGDCRGETLSRMRTLIKEAGPDVVEELKWVKRTNPGTPTWSHDGIICTGETYKSIVKLTFAKGASLKDPAKLFNSSLEGTTRRAIDIHEGEKVDVGAFKSLIRAAVALNTSGGKARPRRVT